MKSRLFSKIRSYCEKNEIGDLLEKCAAVIVGFSGGADSLFLLSYLKEVLPEEKCLCAVHLNHMLRGEEADRDEAFCRSFCECENIVFISEKADVYDISKREKKGIEECARNIRYALFDKCRKKLATDFLIPEEKILVATAHNADDNMETVIFNITRGTSAAGIGGIPPVRDGVYVRPLLCISSLEIREYLAENKVDFVFDSSNAEDGYTRNRIRHNVVPVLRKINPSVEKAFMRLSESVRRDEDYFEAAVSDLLDCERKKGSMPLSVLGKAHPSILSRALLKLYAEVSGESLSSVHIADICRMIKEGKRGELHLPYRVTVSVDSSVSFFVETNKIKEKTAPFFAKLTEGINSFEALDFVLSVRGINKGVAEKCESIDEKQFEHGYPFNIYNSLIKITLNNDKIKGTVFVRNRRESDVYLLGGHRRKLKKLFCDKKIPREMRDRLPIVCDEEGILWIPGFPPRDGTAYKNDGDELTIGYYTADKD